MYKYVYIYNLIYPLGIPNIDVENPWFPYEHTLQMVDFPHLSYFTIGYMIKNKRVFSFF